MWEIIRVATLFETLATLHVSFDHLREVWPYVMEDHFGDACKAVPDVATLAGLDESDCLRISQQLKLPLFYEDRLSLPLQITAPNSVTGSAFTQAKRSEVMSRIRSRGNRSTEGRLVALMKEAGITGGRRQVELVVKQARGAKAKVAAVEKVKPLKVRPDFVFRRERVVVFVDGCFRHGCPRHATRPKQNRKFWDAKIAGNKARDARVTRGLRKAGWKVLRIWECALTVKRRPATLNRLRRALTLGMECG